MTTKTNQTAWISAGNHRLPEHLRNKPSDTQVRLLWAAKDKARVAAPDGTEFAVLPGDLKTMPDAMPLSGKIDTWDSLHPNESHAPRCPTVGGLNPHLGLYRGSGLVPLTVWRGRWFAQCPMCSHMNLAHEDEYLMCEKCANKGTEPTAGKWLRCPFPYNRSAIERLLIKRPEFQDLNWDKQTLEELEKENRDMGLPGEY